MYLIFVHGCWLTAPKSLRISWDKSDKGDFCCFNTVTLGKPLGNLMMGGWLPGEPIM